MQSNLILDNFIADNIIMRSWIRVDSDRFSRAIPLVLLQMSPLADTFLIFTFSCVDFFPVAVQYFKYS